MVVTNQPRAHAGAARPSKRAAAAAAASSDRSTREELRAFRAGKKYDRHKAVRVFLLVLAALFGPVVSWPVSSLLQQEAAVTEWAAVDAYVHNATIKDLSLEKRRRVRFRAEWAPAVTYSYVLDGVNYTSENVWYYGISVGQNYTLAKEVVEAYPSGRPCTAYVNPAAPEEALLRQDVWFRPYSIALGLAMVAQVVAYLFAMEYDWRAKVFSTRKFPPVEAAAPASAGLHKWHAVDAGLRLKRPGEYLAVLLLMVLYHCLGVCALHRFWARPHLQYGWREVAFGYHVVGAAIMLRTMYYAYLGWYLGELELWVNQPKLTVDHNVLVRIRQDVRGARAFKTLKMTVVCRRTSQKNRHNKSKRHDEFLFNETIDLNRPLAELQELTEGRGAVDQKASAGRLELPPGAPLDVTLPLCFPQHPSADSSPKPNERVFTQWFVMCEVRAAGMLLSYATHQTVHVHDHPRS